MSEIQEPVRNIGGGGGRPQYKVLLGIVVVGILFFSCKDSNAILVKYVKLLVSFHQVQVQVVPDDGTLRLQWEVSNKVSHVVVRAVSEREVVQVNIPAIEYKSLFQRNKYYHLKGLKSLTDYTLYFDVRSSNGARSQVVKRVRTKEDITAPKDRLQQVKVKKISGGIRISWDKESVKAGKTDIEQAMIRIKDITTNKVIKEVRVRDIEKGEVNIPELGSKGGKIYDIGAIYEDRNGNKASSEDRLLTNIEISKLSNKEEGIFFKELSVEAKDKEGKEADESLHIKWGDFVYTDGKQVSVQVRETATEVLLLDTKIRETSEEKVSEAVERSNDYVSWYEAKDGVAVRKLYGIQEYSIEVSAYKNGVYFSGVEKKATTTDKQTESVRNISVVANATSIIVGWRSPAVRDYAGVEISVEKDGVLVVVKQETDNTVEQVVIRGLEERTTYNILVRSVDRAGNKGRAVVRNGITTRKDEEAPESPSDIRVNYMAVLSERVASTIGWQEPLRSKARNQDIKVYKLIIRKKEEGREIVSQEITYPTIEYYTELLENTTEYSVSLYSEDYAGNTSGVTTKIIRTPSPIEAPEARVLEGLKPVLETSGEIQIVATFKEGAGEGEVYTISMYEGAIFIATKSIRGAAKEIRFGIGEGLEVPREKEQAKRYGFKLIKEVNGVVSSATDLTPSEEEKIEVYDSISTPPPAPKRAEILFEREINEREIRAKYRFTVGDFTSEYKALDGNVLKKDEVLYKVYVVEGDKRSRSGEEIKEQAIRTQAIPVLTVEGETTKTEHTVFFEGKRGTTYTAVIEAINKRNPSSYTHVEGGSETKQTIRLKIPHTVPKASSFADDNAVVYTVLETGKNVLTVAIKKADIEGVETTDGRELTDGDIAYYVLYAKAEELRRKPGSVEELWRAEEGGDSIVKYIKVIGDDRAVIRVEIVDSRSEGDMGSTPVEEAKDYYIGVRIVNTTAREYNANDSSKLFIDNYYGDIEEIKEVRSSQAEAPAKSLLEGILSVGRSTVREGAIKVELKELRDFTEGRDYAGKAISSNEELKYRVYGIQKETVPTEEEVLAVGKEVALGLASGGSYIQRAISVLGIAVPEQEAIEGGKSYHFVVEVAIATDESKKVLSSVASVETSGATAPGEVRAIRVASKAIRATVAWEAPALSTRHKSKTGEQLKTAEVSYKVYKRAKNGDTERTVEAIKTVDNSPQIVGAGTTRFELTGLTEDTSYELVVQAVNATDDTQESEGAKYEFKTKESFASPGIPTIQARANGNGINGNIRAPNDKGTAEDGTALRDEQIEYRVYYAPSNREIDAETVKTRAKEAGDVKAGGVKIIGGGVARYSIAGLHYGRTYYITVEAVNSFRSSKKSRPSIVVRVETGSAATASGEATVLTADESTERQLRFRAEAPRDTGKQADGLTVVEASALRYWLYYAKFGETSNGVSVTSTTSAADVVSAVGTVIHARNKDRGRIERDSRTLVDGFVLTGLTGGVKYRYTIVTVHPEGVRYNSAPAGAKTATVKSEATASGEATVLTADDTMQKRLTFTARAPMNTGTKADGTAVEESALRYWLYYAKLGETSNGVSVTSTTSAVDVVSAVGTVIHARGKDRGRIERTGRTLVNGFVLTGLTGGVKYRYTIVTVHPEGVRYNSAPAPAETATVKSEATASGEATVLTADESTERQLRFRAEAPRDTGTQADGTTAVNANALRYWLYYAKLGETVNGVSVTSTTSAVDVVSAVGTVTHASSKEVGRIERTGRTLADGFVLTGLTGGVKYRYTIVTVYPDPDSDKFNSAPAGAKTATVKSEATASGEATVLTADDTMQKRLTFRARAPSDTGKQADGTTAVNANALRYWLYYAKFGETSNGVSVTSTTSATDVVKAVGTVTNDRGKEVGRIEQDGRTLADGFVLTGLTGGVKYRYTIVTVHPEGVRYNSAPAGAKTATVKSEATAPGEVTSPTVTEQGDEIIVTANPPSDRGKKIDGSSVSETEIKYTLYYVKVGGDDGVPIQANAVGLIQAKAEETGLASTLAGKKALRGDTALATGFRIAGLTEDTLYQYFIRVTNSDDAAKYSDTSEVLVFTLKPRGGKAEVIQPTLEDGTPRKEIGNDEYKRSGTPIRHINIPRTITKIGEGAFQDNRLKRVVLPDSLEELGAGAFEGNEIEEVTFGSQLRSIPDGVFRKNRLRSLVIPDTVEGISKNAFMDNNDLREVKLSKKLFDTIGAEEGGLVEVFGDQVLYYRDHDEILLGGITAPGEATILLADESTERQLRFRAEAPRDTGTQADGTTAVEANALRYWLYYAKLGETVNGVSVTSTTSAADVVKAVGTVTNDMDKEVGRIERTGGTLADGFVLTGLTGGVKYRYTIVTVYPDSDKFNSAPAGAKTATVKSEATASGEATVLTADDTMQKRLTFRARAPSDTGKQADGTTAVNANALRYWLYYAKLGETSNGVSVTSTTSATDVVSAVGTVTNDRGKEVGRIEQDGRTLADGFVLTGLTGGVKYRYTIVTVHPEGVRYNSAPAGAKTATVKSEATAPGEVTSPTVTEQGDEIIVTANPPSDRGKKIDGSSVSETEIKYTLYYVKVGGDDGVPIQANAVGLIQAKAEETGLASTLAGKKALRGDTALATGFRIAGLTEDTLYQYFIRVTNSDDAAKYSDTSEVLVFTLKPRGGKAEVIQPTLEDGTPRKEIGNDEYKRSGTPIRHINIPRTITKIGEGAFQDNRLKRVVLPDSLEELGAGAFEGNEIEEVTFGSQLRSIPDGVFRKNRLRSLVIPDTVEGISKNAFMDNNDLREVKLSKKLFDTIGAEEGGLVEVFGDQVLYYRDHDEILLGGITAPGEATILLADESTERQLRFRAEAPRDTGTQADGTTAVEANALRYWLYYAKLGETVNGVSVTSTTSAADVVKAVGTVTNDMDKEVGRIERTGGTLADGFVLTGLTGGVKYRYTIVTVYPDSDKFNSAPAGAKTATVKSEATAPAEVSNIQVTSKATIATVVWDAPTLDESHKTRKGEQLTTAEVSYKVYIVEKNGDTERTVINIKAADNSPQTVGAGRTRLELIGLTKNTSYELVVQAVNSTDETKASIGIRKEFKTNESLVIRDIKGWKEHATPPWSERDSNTVNFKNRIWIIGGVSLKNYFNEVWSSADGKVWKQHDTYVKGDSTKKKPIWSARDEMAIIVFKNKIWIIGGMNYSPTDQYNYNDVWSSADGEAWEKHTTRNEDTSKTNIWSERLINAFVKFNDRIWIFGGSKGTSLSEIFYDDVWSSADGEKWKKHSTSISDTKITTFWNNPNSAIVFNDEIWLIDTNTGIWKSADGEVWTTFGNKDILLRNATLLQWDNKLWILGGWRDDDKKDISKKVWSSGDGKTWYEHTVRNVNKTNTIWADNTQGTFIVFKNKLWLLGGWTQGYYKYNNDVWSFPHTIQE